MKRLFLFGLRVGFVVHSAVYCCFDIGEQFVFVWLAFGFLLLYYVGTCVVFICLKGLFLFGWILFFHRICLVCCLVDLSLMNSFVCSAADMERVLESNITNEI